MEHLIYASIIIFGLALFFFLWNAEHRTAARVRREKEAIETEEHRMFDFLHGLGEELIEDSSPPNMHRYITNGVPDVIGANASILYLLDIERERIVPVCQSVETAPVLTIPTELTDSDFDKATVFQKYRALIRLSPLDYNESLPGKTLASAKVTMVDDLADFFGEQSNSIHEGVSALCATLIYAQKKIGILIATRPGHQPFNKNDQDVFASVTEQCSFALGSAIIHIEASENRRLEQELSQASEIQRILLPKENPELSDYRLAATYRPARHLSGDYYDYVKIDQDHYGVVIADVCGKGIAASLIMAMCRSALRSRCAGNQSPSDLLHSVNRSIFPDIREDMFVSFFYLILSRGENKIAVSNAGHEPPLIRRIATGEVEETEVPGLAVGVDKGAVFERVVKNHEFVLETGDVLLLYTDGLIEALNRDGEEFGIDRFRDAFRDAEGQSAQQILDSIMSQIDKFCSGTQATDDITLIAVEKR